ncbi:prolyl oligopeptidase family serine peptidase [Aliiroseovarius subalbicans]|uniref:alpha/beta hydrolase family protein n=1 Tax=Aliiroseovarius subalbicans TaxID=2925840 RepID=UPI001F57E3E8|nr:prolyl oligopeptidase family serine peptidase [Aliiroseovarius subalbicans]MCI2400564.1 prolyl oligopeptidase family serine peptidase [Aliiroseovarius subalbicans]
MKKLTRPFWNRWRAGDVGDDVLFAFLEEIRSLDDWPDAALRMIATNEATYKAGRAGMTQVEEIAALRRLSYMCNLGHWGILPLNEAKRRAYTKARDYYVQAERLAFGDRFQQFSIAWNGQAFPANLHLPKGDPAPLVILVHGIDGCKEEHLATELAMLDAGFAVAAFDGPGQAESFLLNGILWDARFPEAITACIDQLVDHRGVDATRVGIMGMSIGALWTLAASSGDARVKAVYDLGAPINTRAFNRVPFIIKSKMCQITGATSDKDISDVLSRNFIDRDEILNGITAAVRIVHGTKDRVVSMEDKHWLHERFQALGVAKAIEMRIFEDADHCCTSHIPEIRRDMADFFHRFLR